MKWRGDNINVRYYIIVGIGFTVFVLLLLVAGSHDVAATKYCETKSNHFSCTVDLDNNKNFYVQYLSYRKGTSGGYSSISYWDYTAYMEFDSNNQQMPEYDINGGADTHTLTIGPSGDGIIQYNKDASGCSLMWTYYTFSVDSTTFWWNQSIETCDLSTSGLDYALFQDKINTSATTGKNYYDNVYHRSWSEPMGYTNVNPYVYKLNENSATWQEPRNEIFVSNYPQDASGYRYKVKMRDNGNTYAVNYTPWPDPSSSNVMEYQISRRTGGASDGSPLFGISGEDTHGTDVDVWWYDHAVLAAGSTPFTQVYNCYYPDRSSWS